VIAPDDPNAPDVRALIELHLAFAREHTPQPDVHALEADDLLADDISFFTYRLHGELLAMGALKMLDATHAELKSMHTVESARGQGIGRALVDQLVEVAQHRGIERVSIETGPQEAFAPARALYAAAGFEPCEPFGAYVGNTNSYCLTRIVRPKD
jgi:putative acetyltransferase